MDPRKQLQSLVDEGSKTFLDSSWKLFNASERAHTTRYLECFGNGTIGYSNTSKVADELIKEFDPVPETKVDQKNVRRRVYDALNVFMALGIIHKDKCVC
jgi:hypothetical protein